MKTGFYCLLVQEKLFLIENMQDFSEVFTPYLCKKNGF
ncbi:hypothetical protein T4B_7600 [Trichinella pseudospiralis]|uniref:Uncharacterized protein n=1 Tax=Trichinella pseudospiralis TaxID=6337 RepID=A0A0V1GDH2_TRIPS|nr:hypothetical protein T4B_7600 [Trichinella pseudospiralis]